MDPHGRSILWKKKKKEEEDLNCLLPNSSVMRVQKQQQQQQKQKQQQRRMVPFYLICTALILRTVLSNFNIRGMISPTTLQQWAAIDPTLIGTVVVTPTPDNTSSSSSSIIANSHPQYRDDSHIIFDENSSTQLNQDKVDSNDNNNTTMTDFMEYRGQRRSHSYFDPNQIVRSQSQLHLLHDVDSDLSSAKNNDTNTEYVEFTRLYEKATIKKIETWKAKKFSFNECVTDELQKWKKEYTNSTTTSTFGVLKSQLPPQQPAPLYIGWRKVGSTLNLISLMLEAEDMRRNSRGLGRGGSCCHNKTDICLTQYFDFYSKYQQPFSGEYDFFNWLDYGSGRYINLRTEMKRLQKSQRNNLTNITDRGMNQDESYCTRAMLDRKTIRLFTKEETASYETYLIPYNSEIVTDNNDNDNDNNSVNNTSLQQQQQQKSSGKDGNNNNNNKIQAINSLTGKPLKEGFYLFVLTMDVVDNEDLQQQQQQQKKKSQSKLLLFPELDKIKHTSPYPGAMPVWHAGELWIENIKSNDNDDGTYISKISAGSGHYLPRQYHVRWFQHWMETSAYNTSSNSSSSSSSKKHHHLLKHQQQQELNIESIIWIDRHMIQLPVA